MNPAMIQSLAESAASTPSPLWQQLRQGFEAWVVGGDIQMLSTVSAREWLNERLPEPRQSLGVELAVRTKDVSLASSEAYWAAFVAFCTEKRFAWLPWRIILDLSLPCIDLTQFAKAKSTLKMPFSVHVTTGQIALPLTAEQMSRFDPAASLHVQDTASATGQDTLQRAATVMDQWLTANAYPV